MINHRTIKEKVAVRGDWLFYLDGVLVAREKNTIVDTGLQFIAQLLTAEEPNSMSAHIAMGTGTSEVLSGNNKLEAEGGRGPIISKGTVGALCRFRSYFMTTEANGDWTEFGLFLKSTDVAESGVLLNRVLTPISKAANQTLTIEVRITFAAI